MKTLLPAVFVVGLLAAGLYAGQSPTPTITAIQTRAFVGQLVNVEDTVVQVSREPQSGFTYINFGGDYPYHNFRVVVPQAVERLILASVFSSRQLRVRGVPQLGPSGIPEIICSDPTQVAVAAAAPLPAVSSPPAIPAPAAMTPAPAKAAPACCRVCSNSKACGNGCISRTATCRQPPGCACQG
jgi:hypothetical protein